MNKTPTWWQTILLTLICSLITAAFSWGLIRSGTTSDKTNEVINQKADKVYVDKQDERLDEKIDTKVDKEAFKLVTEDLKDIKENTRMIIKNQMEKK